MISIANQTPQHLDDIWCAVSCFEALSRLTIIRSTIVDHIALLLSTPTQYSILLIERAVMGLLRMCHLLAMKVSRMLFGDRTEPDSSVQPSLRDQIYVSFDLLAGLPPLVSNAVAEQVMHGVGLIIQHHPNIIKWVKHALSLVAAADPPPARSPTEWNIVFALIRSTMANQEASRLAFELITRLANDGPGQLVTIDNFPGLVGLRLYLQQPLFTWIR